MRARRPGAAERWRRWRATSRPYSTSAFAVSDKAIFLGAFNVGRIVKCDLPGCTSWHSFLTGDQAYVLSIATDDKRVFWTPGPDGAVYDCAVDGTACTGVKRELGPTFGNGEALFLKVDRGTLFITTSNGAVFSCDPARCSETVRTLAREPRLAAAYRPFGPPIAADARAVYYAAVDGPDAGTDAGATATRIMKVAR